MSNENARIRQKPESAAYPSRPAALETVATIISGLLVLATIAFLIYESKQADQPPAFELDVKESRMAGEFYYLPVKVHNRGHQAAQSVMVVVKLESDKAGSQPVEAEAQLQWLPGRSSREVVCVFRENPDDYAKITPEVKGYEVP